MSQEIPSWAKALAAEDWHFLKIFLLASGSLKALAEQYSISYPTVRARLDRLIAKVQAADRPDATDEFHRQIRIHVAEGRLDSELARSLLATHRKTLEEAQDTIAKGDTTDDR